MEVRVDPRGDLGKPRSGIPSFCFGVRGRRRAQFPQPEPPISLRVYAGAEQEPRVVGAERVSRLGGAVQTRRAEAQCKGGFRLGMGVGRVVDGVPFTWGIKDYNMPPPNSLAKVGIVSESVFSRDAGSGRIWLE